MDYLTEYNPDWPAWFLEIEHYLRPRLAGCLGIEHVGSTSVVGMAAKPIIDIVMADGSMGGMIASVERAGYVHQGDLGITGREAFQASHEVTRRLPPHHLYACEASSSELLKHLSFRQYLRAHPSETQRLTEFKCLLAFRQRVSRGEYIEAKSPLVGEITALALAWYGTYHDA